MLVYLDDWLVQAPSQAECAKVVELVLSICTNLALAVNAPKSQLVPFLHLLGLGMSWDSSSTFLALSEQWAAGSVLSVQGFSCQNRSC